MKPALFCFLSVSKKDTTCLYLESRHDQQPHLENLAVRNKHQQQQSLHRNIRNPAMIDSTIGSPALIDDSAIWSSAVLENTAIEKICVVST